jgi:hypothetical protein
MTNKQLSRKGRMLLPTSSGLGFALMIPVLPASKHGRKVIALSIRAQDPKAEDVTTVERRTASPAYTVEPRNSSRIPPWRPWDAVNIPLRSVMTFKSHK